MLDHLRKKIIDTLSHDRTVLLSSFGPADLQTSRLPCVLGKDQPVPVLYLLAPRASEHLLNLEHRPTVVVIGEGWEMHGVARVLGAEEAPAGLPLDTLPESTLGRLVIIYPARIHLRNGVPETIDCSE